ncbi:dihydrolipoyltranssuccinase [uncultured Alphaproteobacteria bacterium]|uniref:Dihydrolipoyllysine-residue succinyltransferase component of 2-oxoglutarate dehydrogenase complex n=1 Tax=uncultured Alphaproteobacteria bacterium TaxID=91750 RepID=A0A212K0P0_9PROT|nr:dihydrolipoyltranssuccinase [uncultured Alphaproteobacteria bacterium]
MSYEIVVPTLGESVVEATVAKWFKQVGEAVQADEPLVELETDKVTVEVNAPASGTLTEIVAAEGAEVEVGALLARIGAAGAAPTPAKPAPAAAPKPAAGADVLAAAVAAAGTPAEADDGLAPAVRKLVAENNLDPKAIPATGKDGRLTKEDVINFLEGRTKVMAGPAAAQPLGAAAPKASAPAAPRAADPREQRVKMTRLRRRIAERLKDAQNTAAILTTFNEVDMTGILSLREQYKSAFEKKHGIRLGFMSFFVKACVAALKEIPAVNAEISGDEIVFKNYYDVGVAVGTDQGLVVPVVRDCDVKSFAQIEKEIASLAGKARDGKLTMEDMTGGTFTVTNGGVYGSLMSTPIINPPQSGILGMHKTMQRPMVMPDGSIAARPMMYIALSYDHRIIDGGEAVTFLVKVKEALEDPARLVLGV